MTAEVLTSSDQARVLSLDIADLDQAAFKPSKSRQSSAKPQYVTDPAQDAEKEARKARIRLPNLLQKSKLGRAVVKLASSSTEGTAIPPRYTSSGHRCWSSLRTREWQEFQRSMKQVEGASDYGGDGESTSKTPVSFLYFSNSSPRQSTRGSKRTIRKQIVSPDSDYYERARMRDFCLVEDAYEVTKQSKNQRWRDILDGVPSQYNSDIQPVKCKIIYDDHQSIQKRIKKQQAQWREERLSKSAQNQGKITADDEQVNQDSNLKLSRGSCRSVRSAAAASFHFPKTSDFVPCDGTKVAEMGVDWRYRNCYREGPKTFSSRANSAPTDNHERVERAPRQHKASYNPVTSALRRGGLTAATLRGKVPTSEELEVAKMWKRKITAIVIPAHMAKYDLPDKEVRLAELISQSKSDDFSDTDAEGHTSEHRDIQTREQ